MGSRLRGNDKEGWEADIDQATNDSHDNRMMKLPEHLLEPLASIEEQRRFVIEATTDEYLLPEEMLNDAWQFCEQAENADLRDTLTDEQQAFVRRLKDALVNLGDCVGLYDRSNIADLIERDRCWAVIRNRASEALNAFRPRLSI